MRMTERVACLAVLVAAAVAIVGTPVARAATQDADGDWTTHFNAAGGYAIEYPASWHVADLTDAAGQAITVFSAQSGETVAAVVASPAGAAAAAESDLPHVRCQSVVVQALAGRMCLDTLTATTITTVFGPQQTYTLWGSRRARGAYATLLSSFRLSQSGSALPSPDPASAGDQALPSSGEIDGHQRD